jgi:hypothetical protein
MRDLREDLRERLRAIAIERGALQNRLQYLDTLETQTKGILDYETARVRAEHAADNPALFPELDSLGEKEGSELSQFLRDILSDGNPRSLEDLKQAAHVRHFKFGDKNPGRVLHFALLGMSQNGLVEMVERGVWKLGRTQ